MRKLSSGVRRHGAGWQAYLRVGGRLITRSFPAQTALATMQAWRAGERLIAQRQTARDRPARGSLAGDVAAYLDAHAHMPTIRERRRQLARWLDALGGWRTRDTVTPQEVSAVLSRWRVERGWAPQTVNHYRTALASLYAWLEGRGAAANPVRAVPKLSVPVPPVPALPYPIIAAILREIRPGKTWARLGLLAYCGVPYATQARVTPDQIDWRTRVIRLPPRRKGHGTAGRLLPVTPRQLVWWRRAVRLEAIGTPFSGSAVCKSFHLAAKKARAKGVPVPPGVRPYDLRHALGATAYLVTGDLATVARLLDHAGERTTRRYAEAAFSTVDAAAMRQIGAAQQGRKLPGKVASTPESRKSPMRP